MKKIVSLLLCFFLLAAAGCAKTEAEPPTQADTDAEPVSQSAQLVFWLDELPSLERYVPIEKARFFFGDGPRNVLEARDDYGGLVPYIAEYKIFHEPKFYSYKDENGITVSEERTEFYNYDTAVYGLMTEDGRIVTGGLWYEVNQYTDPDGNIVYLLAYVEDKVENQYGWGYMYCSCLAAADGSWVLSFEDVSVGKLQNLPYFEACTKNWIQLYSMNGKLTATLYPEKTDADIDDMNFQILFADANRIVTETYYYSEEDIPSRITVWDWQGKKLSGFQKDINFSYLGAELLYEWTEDGLCVYDCEGTLLDDKAYDFIYYGKAEHQFLALSEQGGTYTAAYFDENWTRVYPENGWPSKNIEHIDEEFSVGNKTVLCNYENDVLTDFYGNPISLPVPETEILEKQIDVDYSDYDFPKAYLRIFTADAMLVCSADGTLLQRIEPLPGLTAEETQTAFQEIRCDDVLFLTDSCAYAVSIGTGEVRSCAMDNPKTILAADPRANKMYRYIDDINGDMIVISQSLTGGLGLSDYYTWTLTAYGTSEGFPTIRNVMSCYQVNGFWSFATKNTLLTLSPDGTVLFQTRIDQSV